MGLDESSSFSGLLGIGFTGLMSCFFGGAFSGFSLISVLFLSELWKARSSIPSTCNCLPPKFFSKWEFSLFLPSVNLFGGCFGFSFFVIGGFF